MYTLKLACLILIFYAFTQLDFPREKNFGRFKILRTPLAAQKHVSSNFLALYTPNINDIKTSHHFNPFKIRFYNNLHPLDSTITLN
ncbi:CLUMA_CG000385, isoform A [Clunio marinus]|uniref:CLUMA_CG000385, isoform A n=1 Tax=Clunio marinus TaxID=568069 RepID=A0A1J1HI83_9DIPT|nr:CLUMA_CG000385, isoform A [Clunio marinus]